MKDIVLYSRNFVKIKISKYKCKISLFFSLLYLPQPEATGTVGKLFLNLKKTTYFTDYIRLVLHLPKKHFIFLINNNSKPSQTTGQNNPDNYGSIF